MCPQSNAILQRKSPLFSPAARVHLLPWQPYYCWGYLFSKLLHCQTSDIFRSWNDVRDRVVRWADLLCSWWSTRQEWLQRRQVHQQLARGCLPAARRLSTSVLISACQLAEIPGDLATLPPIIPLWTWFSRWWFMFLACQLPNYGYICGLFARNMSIPLGDAISVCLASITLASSICRIIANT